jgi:hypothetical protein
MTTAGSPEVILLHDPGVCAPFCSSAFTVLGSAGMDLEVAQILKISVKTG